MRVTCDMYWTVRLTPQQYQQMQQTYPYNRYLWSLLRKSVQRRCGKHTREILPELKRSTCLLGKFERGNRRFRLWFRTPIPVARILIKRIPQVRRWKKRRTKSRQENEK